MLKVGIIGLGYVGLPLARLMSTKYSVVGYDTNITRVKALQNGTDETGELEGWELRALLKRGVTEFKFTGNIDDLQDCTVYIVAVPTPIDIHSHPDLIPLQEASNTVGRVLKKGDIVIYESTVYPGVTEEVCVPLLSSVSQLKYNEDFFVGYSPERINPGDREHSIETIKKVTAGSTPECAKRVDDLYASVLKAGTHPVSSIRVAEASKIVENTQRDVNIAFINECAKIFNAMGLDTNEVLEAAATKWNFIKMKPGLVGGHCISIDPYYLIQNAQVHGIVPRVTSEARKLNDSMGIYVANQVLALMNKKDIQVSKSQILLLGYAFKENCPDTRNTKVLDIYRTLIEYTPNVVIYDPHVCSEHPHIYNKLPMSMQYDAIVLCVAHKEFLTLNYATLRNANSVIYDVKSVLPTDIIDGRL